MTVVLQRPYEFVPPFRWGIWPSFIQAFRLIDWHLRRKEGVVEYECRNLGEFRKCIDRGDGILLTPNHCRYADPIVMGWPGREANTHLYAMASWHLFNTNAFERFALRRMGAFSIHREASDKQSLDTAIQILTDAERPLIVFPEGTTNRTNDLLKPLLDGVAFMARTAAKRRAKRDGGQVVMLPVAIKYLCKDDIRPWADRELGKLEQRLGWHKSVKPELVPRTIRLAEGMLALKEIEYTGRSSTGELPPRRDALMNRLLEQSESDLKLVPDDSDDVRDRVRKIRAEVVGKYFALDESEQPRQRHRLSLIADQADFAQNLLSFPDCYLTPGQVTDTRLLETIQRIQESIYGKATSTMPLKAVVEFGGAIEVPGERAPRGQRDPLMMTLEDALNSMLEPLSREAKSLG
ncbi:MAG: 1-acyl-sn-glycerol-3-phosphate acyltransferase [Planctomycetota bacterium]